MLLNVEQADHIEKASTLWDGIHRVVGEGDDAAPAVGVGRALDLQPQGSKASNLGDHDVAVVHVRLDTGGKEAAVGTGEYLRLDHQLDQGSERGALNHADRLLDIACHAGI